MVYIFNQMSGWSVDSDHSDLFSILAAFLWCIFLFSAHVAERNFLQFLAEFLLQAKKEERWYFRLKGGGKPLVTKSCVILVAKIKTYKRT